MCKVILLRECFIEKEFKKKRIEILTKEGINFLQEFPS